jgi:hypothetical protein
LKEGLHAVIELKKDWDNYSPSERVAIDIKNAMKDYVPIKRMLEYAHLSGTRDSPFLPSFYQWGSKLTNNILLISQEGKSVTVVPLLKDSAVFSFLDIYVRSLQAAYPIENKL